MIKKIAALLGLLICIIGALVYFLDTKNSNVLPTFLKGTSFWILLLGSSVSLFYSFFERNRKEE